MENYLQIGDTVYCEITIKDENTALFRGCDFEISKDAVLTLNEKPFLRGKITSVEQGDIEITLDTGSEPTTFWCPERDVDHQGPGTVLNEILSEEAWEDRVNGYVPAELPRPKTLAVDNLLKHIPKPLLTGTLIFFLFFLDFNLYRGITADYSGLKLFAYILCELVSLVSPIPFCLTFVFMYLAHREGSSKKVLQGIALLLLGGVLLVAAYFLKNHFGF